VKLNKSATETFASLTEAYRGATLSRTAVFKWHGPKKILKTALVLEDQSRQHVEVVRAVMVKDRRMNVRMVAGQTVNHTCYKDVLERLRKRVKRFRKDIADDWVLHHDNASAHTAP
jgi:hypothetical protein